MRKSTKEERKLALEIVQKETGRKQPRRFLQKMFDMNCLYFVVYENKSKEWLKKEIDRYFE